MYPFWFQTMFFFKVNPLVCWAAFTPGRLLAVVPKITSEITWWGIYPSSYFRYEGKLLASHPISTHETCFRVTNTWNLLLLLLLFLLGTNGLPLGLPSQESMHDDMIMWYKFF